MSRRLSRSRLPVHPAVPLVAFGAGVLLASDPEQPARFTAYAASARRAVRLAGACSLVAFDYSRAKRSLIAAEKAEFLDGDAAHWELQVASGKAERLRADAVRRGEPSAVLEEEARRTREEAAAYGEALAGRRLEAGQRSGRAAAWDEVHERNAARLLALCIANGGVYVKLGQHAAQLDYLLPPQYTRTLHQLFEHNRASSYEDVSRVIEEELGAPPEALFGSFERAPIASASLAQVHRATEHGTGAPLAVKVQHAGLREECASDLQAVGLAVAAAEWLYPDDFRLGWTPAVVGALTSARVLTMTYEEGVSVTDVAGLRRLGLDPNEVSRLLCEAFNAMIFDGGFVHCDPHPGNVLVQLVLLDHGLYRDLPRAFALTYSRLWHGVVLGDADAIREAAEEMGVGQYYPLLAAMLTARPWTDILRAGDTGDARALQEKGTAADKKQIAGYAAQYAKHIGIVLDLVPRPLLLLFKTNDCLRHAERQLGAAGGALAVARLRQAAR
ncbi:hypothetical protein EMIHUDRAFT_234481 [Emiliania huxleyi CCMP1516]|uniref:ABC1 atypical kinase-like domain-containing protein n=2 Tax=Emiliania huxleyi TaxID=2903 RepID=A0A0D3JZ84_EMIH1|nr:hypothetical protein EMIHUDRAFT_234481 [Emiliania huxleyi CCMP1516]EOD28819.1 hypothetical protein EMIHUDRAFT_234481 [Emiliania huxleyi CCMP1516]|eukprot:XP_005781248.1 hypothetical protein EMIHUDRAFT_234481 [Emiliania huxleyi CCMP1516]